MDAAAAASAGSGSFLMATASARTPATEPAAVPLMPCRAVAVRRWFGGEARARREGGGSGSGSDQVALRGWRWRCRWGRAGDGRHRAGIDERDVVNPEREEPNAISDTLATRQAGACLSGPGAEYS